MHNTNRLDLVLAVLGKLGFDHVGVGTAAPVALDEFGIDAELACHLAPQAGEVAGLEHQDLVALLQGIGQRGFPRARSRRRIDNDRSLALEDLLDPFQDLAGHAPELRAAVIDRRLRNRTQNPTGNIGWTGYLKKVRSSRVRVVHEFPPKRWTENIPCDDRESIGVSGAGGASFRALICIMNAYYGSISKA